MPFVAPEHHGEVVILAMLGWSGDDAAGERAIAPFRGLAGPLADLVKPMPYLEMFPPDDPHRLAREVLTSFNNGDGSTLAYFRGRFHIYDGTTYRPSLAALTSAP